VIATKSKAPDLKVKRAGGASRKPIDRDDALDVATSTERRLFKIEDPKDDIAADEDILIIAGDGDGDEPAQLFLYVAVEPVARNAMTATPLRQTDQRRLDQFRSFYDLLIGLRDQLKAPRRRRCAELGREAIQQRLRTSSRSSAMRRPRTIRPPSSIPATLWAAMADEVMLMDWGNWRDRGAWADQPWSGASMARACWRSGVRGGRSLVAGLRDETGTAILILTCVLLGFRGGYRTPAARPIDRW